MGFNLLHAAACSLLWVLALAQVPVPFNLQTSFLTSPIGIDTVFPRLSWSVTHPAKSQYQTKYRVQVTQQYQGKAILVWDSQSVTSSHTYAIYGSVGAAKQLVSDSSYTWQVQWWDATGNASSWSAPASFGTGYLSQNDWVASWIGGQGNILRREFTLDSVLANTTARAYISGIGYYELYLNGQRVGDARLDVGWTTYNKRCHYSVYNVSALLMPGKNAIGVMQGHGWYASTEAGEPNGPRSLLFQLSVNGQVVVMSDQSWDISRGPITSDGVYNGETYDARLEQPGWTSPNFVQGSGWIKAITLLPPDGVLSYQAIPPVREILTITPKRITTPAPGIWVLDFEQNFSGWIRITMKGPSGAMITLRHAEVLLKDGSGQIYVGNLRNAKATDHYIFKGSSSDEVYEPRFTYHGFRYVQINSTSPLVIPTLANVLGIHVHSDVGTSGSIMFNASSNILNKIQHNVVWGQASNLMSVPTDCDQRDERKGWMGDAQLSGEEAVHNYYMPSFYTNFLRLIQDEQDTNGTLTDTVPWTFGSRPADPAWGSAYPSLLYWTWKYYDDIELVQQHYDSIKLYLEYLNARHADTGLGNMFYNYGDWVPPAPAPMCDSHLTSSFAYLSNIAQFLEMAQALGNTKDVATYTAMWTSLSEEFNQAFYNYNYTVYDTGLQTAQVLPLWLNITPPPSLENFTINLLNDVVTFQQTHLTTGIIGTKYLMLALHNIGRDDLALQLAENFDYPSWGYMAVHPTEPATTLWELWDTPDGDPSMDSRNHIMFGSVGDWFYKALAGIDHPKSDVGFAQITIAPSVVGDLRGVSANVLVATGNISVSWNRQGGAMACGTGAEGQLVSLDCASIGSTGVIEEITFASFGTPRGTCGTFGENSECMAPKARTIIESHCIGQSSCSFLAHEDVLGAALCETGVFKRLHVQAKCSEAVATSFNLLASIPVGSTANVVLPALDLTDVKVTINGAVAWQSHKYIQAAEGISSGKLTQSNLNFVAGSGEYQFQVTGKPGSVMCFNTTENFNLTLGCTGSDVITQVQFASFGTPEGECGSLTVGDCNAGSSKYLVEKYCLFQKQCTLYIASDFFHDPCYSTPKSFASQVLCATI